MATTTKHDLFNLLQKILTIPCLSISSGPLAAALSNPISSNDKINEDQAPDLILSDARTASIPLLVEFILQILLTQPPFTYKSPGLLIEHRSIFFEIWNRDHTDGSISGENDDEQRLPPQKSLHILAETRMSFQRLTEDGFQFVSELLLSCLLRLSLVNTAGRSWVIEHGKAVKVLSELLHSVPDAGWLSMDTNFEYMATLWKCLNLLTAGAPWWGSKSEVYRKNLLSLSKNFFTLPTAFSLLRAAVRVDLRPVDIFSTIDLLLMPLERFHGFATSENINAFTPTPFNFPVFPSLINHDFTRPYEFANLRILFISWISSDAPHRDLAQFRSPWSISMVLQHPEAFNRLALHPESAARIALAYIFNEVQLGGEGFKPSTDMKAIRLLKIFILYRHDVLLNAASTPLNRVELSPEAFITMNAEWVLPWLWQRRTTDIDFVMAMTNTWMKAACNEGKEKKLHMKHPVIMLLKKNPIGLEVISYLFRLFFVYDFGPAAVSRLGQYLELTTEVVRLIFISQPELISVELCSQIIRCFICSVAMERGWIPFSCWELVCMLLAKIPKLVLEHAFTAAGVVEKIDMFIQVFLGGIESITSLCHSNLELDFPVRTLADQFATLTAMLQFVVLSGRVSKEICRSLAVKTHFILSMLNYVNQDYVSVLLKSSHPELVWRHAASVGAACEILIISGFGMHADVLLAESVGDSINIPTGVMTEQAKNQNILELISRLVGRAYEMRYVLSPLCELAAMLSTDWWIKKPFVYFELFGYIRMFLLQNEARKSCYLCYLAPVLVHAVEALLKVNTSICQMLVENRWNLELAVVMITRIKDGDVCCEQCDVNFEAPILKLVMLLVEKRPRWHRDLLLERELGQYSILTIDIIFAIFKRQMKQTDLSTQIGEDQMALGEMVVRIANVFPEWETKPELMAMKRGMEQAVISFDESKRCPSTEGICEFFRPVDLQWGSLCFVPKYEIGEWLTPERVDQVRSLMGMGTDADGNCMGTDGYGY